MGGSISSYLYSWAYSPDTTADPTTGLSELDRKLIQKTWSLVCDKKHFKENGVELFMQLFDKFPKTKTYFPQFKDITSEEELRNSPKMRAHAQGVMYMLTNYVSNMDDPETLVAMVSKICEAHQKRDITLEDFEDLSTMFVPFIRSVVGNRVVTPDVEAAWNKLLAAQVAVFKATLASQGTAKDSASSSTSSGE